MSENPKSLGNHKSKNLEAADEIKFLKLYKMKPFILLTLFTLLLACSKQNDDDLNVSNINQLRGEWKWVSTCGGFVQGCTYSSSSNYAVILFSSNGGFLELHNDAIYQKTNYYVNKTNETSGTLILENEEYQRPLRIVNHLLEIQRGELTDTYKKIN
jgi:hypothetical protein